MINNIIRTQRESLGLTLEDVADFCGVAKSTVSRWESGNIVNIRQDKIARLSKILNIRPSKLLGYDEDSEIYYRNEVMKAYREEFGEENLSIDDWKKAFKLLKMMKGE